MSEILRYSAQSAMDMFYGDYKSSEQFFDIEDFVRYCGMTVSDLLLQEYRVMRAENRSDKMEEIIPFSAEWLAEEVVDVEDKEGELLGVLSKRVMSFPFDPVCTGFQDVTALKPKKVYLERGAIDEEWSYSYLPATNRMWWMPIPNEGNKSKLKFFKKGLETISKVRVRYVPSPHEEMVIPDGILNYVVTTTVATMKGIQNGTVVDKTNNGNPNKVIESEIDKKSLKQ